MKRKARVARQWTVRVSPDADPFWVVQVVDPRGVVRMTSRLYQYRVGALALARRLLDAGLEPLARIWGPEGYEIDHDDGGAQ